MRERPKRIVSGIRCEGVVTVIYVMALAPYGIVYVGRTVLTISERMMMHFMLKDREVDKFMRQLSPMEICETRVDLLMPPEDGWARGAEIALIEYFKPMFNVEHQLS